MQTNYEELAKQQQEFISYLIQQLNHGKKDEPNEIYRLQMKVEAQYKSLNCARAQITETNKVVKDIVHRIYKLEKMQQNLIDEDLILSDTSLLNTIVDGDIEVPQNSTQLEMRIETDDSPV